MTTLTEAKTGEELVAEDLENSEVATELERTRHQPTGHPGDRYRVGHGLTQSALARRLGISQPAVARLESGVSAKLGIALRLDVAPGSMVARLRLRAARTQRAPQPCSGTSASPGT